MYIRCGNFGTGMSSSLMAVEHPYPQASAVPILVACKYMQLIPRLLDSMNSITHLWGSLHVQKLSPSEFDPDEGGATRMRGGISFFTLPAGYLGSSLIGAILIACGFDERASKVASIVVAVFFLMMLWWARRNWLYVEMLTVAHGS